MTSLAFLTRGAVGDSRSTRQEHHFGASSSCGPQRDPRPGRSAAPTAAAYTEATAGERHVSRLDGDSQPPDDPFSSLRRPLEKRLPGESGPDAPRRGARPPGTGETPSPSGSRGTRSARGGPGKRPAPRADDSTARRTRDYGRARAPP